LEPDQNEQVSLLLNPPVAQRILDISWRLLEGAIQDQVAQLFDDALMLASRLALDVSPSLLRWMTEQCEPIAIQLLSRSGGPLRQLVRQIRALDVRLGFWVWPPTGSSAIPSRLASIAGSPEPDAQCGWCSMMAPALTRAKPIPPW
jgi:hypothetical protein